MPEQVPIAFKVRPRLSPRAQISLTGLPNLHYGDWVKVTFEVNVPGVPPEISAVLPVRMDGEKTYCCPPATWAIDRNITLRGYAEVLDVVGKEKPATFTLTVKQCTLGEVRQIAQSLTRIGATMHVDGGIPADGDTAVVINIEPEKSPDLISELDNLVYGRYTLTAEGIING